MKRCPLCAQSYPENEKFCPDHALPLQAQPELEGRSRGELTGHVLDHRYQLGGMLGRGGMGTVYHARNLRIGQDCAVKVLLRDLWSDVKMRQRLFREIQACCQVRHRNVIEIYTYGEDDVVGAYLVMEYLTGRSLDVVMVQHGAMPLSFTLKVASQLCAALGAIHGRGLVHCDMKPSNIFLLPSGQIKVLDFGLVKPFDPESAEMYQKITTGSVAFGTPQYMSPEQAGITTPDPRSDIYSMGVILYEMLLGQPPFQGPTPFVVIEAHRNQPPPLPKKINPRVVLPSTLEMLLLRMLSKNKEDRPESVAELAKTIETVAEDLGVDLGRTDLGAVAQGKAPVTEPTQPLEVTIPIPAPAGEFSRIQDLARERRGQMVQQVIDQLRLAIPRYRSLDDQKLRGQISTWQEAILSQLEPQPPEELPESIERLIAERREEQFSATELLVAFWLGYWACRPLIYEVASQNLDRYVSLLEMVDQRILPLYLRVSERYVSQFNARLARKSELLEKQNEELRELRDQLDDQLRRTHSELAEAERVKARVADSISSGLLMVQLDSQRIRLFNKAMERLSGVKAADVLGRPVDEIFHMVEGVPFEEFVEQIQIHGQVGLRKLRIRFPNNHERTVYVRGQPFFDGQEHQTGVLFLLDDVTEREKIIESFSRYVSREVAQRILRHGGPLKPAGEPRRAVLMGVEIHGFRSMMEQLSPEQVVQLLDQYVRLVGNAVFHHGGVIDSVVSGRVLVYFANRNQECLTPVNSAVELGRRMIRLNAVRKQENRPPFSVSISLHTGDVLLVNVGGKRRMVHTVLGEPAEIAWALLSSAGPEEILITREMAKQLNDKTGLEPGPSVTLPNGEQVSSLRIVSPEIVGEAETQELDPPTLT